ncbi:MAG: aconitase family protein, partial [Candidatus Brocadiia bacterium]
MGHTIVEKIMKAHSGVDARPGDLVWIDLDVRSARDFGGASVVKNFSSNYKGEKVADAAKTFFTFDCNAPANTIPYAENQRSCRLFAKEQGIKVFDVIRGIGSHVLIEEGLVPPGCTVVGTDSHLNIMGAVGAFGQGMGDADIAYAFRNGRTWFEVPESVKVVLDGVPPAGITARDITFAVMRPFGSDGALDKVVEVYGPCIDRLDLAGRITLSSQGTEIGAIAVIVPPNEHLLDELYRMT